MSSREYVRSAAVTGNERGEGGAGGSDEMEARRESGVEMGVRTAAWGKADEVKRRFWRREVRKADRRSSNILAHEIHKIVEVVEVFFDIQINPRLTRRRLEPWDLLSNVHGLTASSLGHVVVSHSRLLTRHRRGSGMQQREGDGGRGSSVAGSTQSGHVCCGLSSSE